MCTTFAEVVAGHCRSSRPSHCKSPEALQKWLTEYCNTSGPAPLACRSCCVHAGCMSPPASRPPQLISDELWGSLKPMLPPRPPQTRGRTGRPRTSDRDVLEGIAVVLNAGIGWAKLPPELGYG